VREYEVTIILRPDLEDEARSDVLERVAGWLSTGSEEAEKPSVNQWGQRTLAYPIGKFTDGDYVFYEVKLEPGNVGDIERNFQYADEILRHLVVRKE
jgi:small subunit ribosomal protein S6